jgi:uncharacterized membrane protein HdeD (DUF308 family)
VAMWQEQGMTPIWGIVLIVLGLLAIGAPLATSLVTLTVIGWLMIAGGAAHFFDAWQAEDAVGFASEVSVAFLYVLVGLMVQAHPVLGAFALAFAMGLLFLAEGAVDLIAYIAERHEPGSLWLLANGIVISIVGLTVLSRWPSSAGWAIALLVGIGLLMAGTSRLMLAIETREFLHDIRT